MIGDKGNNLIESVEKLKIITEQSLFGIMIVQDGIFKYFNDIVAKATGYSPDEIKSWTPNEFAQIIHPEDREFVMEQVRKKQLGDSDVVSQYQYRAVRKNGENYWVEVFGKTITYQGRPADLVMIFNITDKIKAEQKLKESEEKFKSIAEQSLMGISVLQDGIYKYLNEKLVEINGYSAEEMKNWTPNEFLKIIHPEDREFVIEQAHKKRAGDPDVINQYQCRIIRKDGEIRWLEIFSKTINYENRNADLIMTYDITGKVKTEQQLIVSEEKFRNIADSSLIGIYVLQDGILKYFNEKFIEIHGYSPDEIKNWSPNEFAQIIHPEDRKFVINQARKKQAGDPDVINQYQFRIRRKDGEIRWLETFSKTINYENHTAELAMIYDITDKIKAEQQLKESEAKFFKAFNTNALSMSISTMEEGRIIEVNNIFLKFLGYNREEVIGKTVKELNLWFDDSERDRIIRYVKEKGNLFNFETKFRSKLGEIKDGLFFFVKIMLNNKPFLLTIVNDITHRKLVEKKLKESEEKFRNITEQSLMGIFVLQDGVFKYFNKKVAETSGYSTEEIKKWSPNEFLRITHPEDREFTREQARKKQAGDPDVINHYIYRIIRKDGKIRWIELFSKTINYEGYPADLAMTHDITDKIKAEQKLKKSKEKYQHAYNQVEFYKDLFIHDINNTLQSLYSSTQLLDMDLEEVKKNKDIQELIEIMYRQIKRGTKLISNVHKLSQLEDHEISIGEVDLFGILNKSIDFIKNAFQERKIQIKIDTFSEKISILGNDLLQDVFENILMNSVKYNRSNIIEIIIKVSQVEQDKKVHCKLEFIDNGIGIEDERKEKVLNRVNLDSKTTYGMGLGLSLVKKIMENHKGKIWIEDKVSGDYSKGTNVILLIQEGGC